jgi:branched-chain amino acid transport system ATP-binding protein
LGPDSPGGKGLVVQGLQVRFGKARVLQGVNLSVGPGEVVGLAGRNGAGKTTLLRSISGAVHRSEGSVSFGGTLLPERPDVVARAGVLHVPEGRGLMHGLSVRDNLRLACAAVGLRYGADVWETTVAAFPLLEPLQHKPAGLLSGGQQQMVAIARGLAAQARLLMVDELSLGLAPKTASEALRFLLAEARLRATALLIVDQNVQSLLHACDRTYFLDHGVTQAWTGGPGDKSWERFILD